LAGSLKSGLFVTAVGRIEIDIAEQTDIGDAAQQLDYRCLLFARFVNDDWLTYTAFAQRVGQTQCFGFDTQVLTQSSFTAKLRQFGCVLCQRGCVAYRL